MHITKCQRHRCSIHIVIPRAIKHALGAMVGTNLVFSHTAPGVVEIRNADALMTAQIKETEK